ncbi:hypothetical protein GCM10027563_33090 [Parasphingorhabdus pacifica]
MLVRIETEHPHGALIRALEAFANLDRGRFARAVGAEQGHYLVSFGPQVDAVDGFGVAEALSQPAYFDGGVLGVAHGSQA